MGLVKIQYIPARTILSSYGRNEGWFGINYNMNLYKGCSHGCIYCDSRSDCYHIEEFDRVRTKKNALVILERELAVRKKTGIVGMGGMSDPYNPFEKELNLTGQALRLIDRYRFGASIATKGTLVLRDSETLLSINRHSPVIIKVTITAGSDSLSQQIEPGAPPSSQRFSALKELSRQGLYTGILLMPLLPFIEDNRNNILSILDQAQESGVSFIYPGFGVTLRMNQREWFYKKLDEKFPGLKEKYKESFGEKYSCGLPRAWDLQKYFKEQCEKRGILHNMADIIKEAHNRQGSKQLSLF